MTEQSPYHDDFYKSFFTEAGQWSTRFPNRDEVQRVRAILPIVTRIAQAHHKQDNDTPLQILDVGSGRGWLSQLLTFYGKVQGVEPVAPVVENARQTYPHIEFTVGTPQTILEKGLDNHFDLIVSSEVLEHVPYTDQQAFTDTIAALLKPNGQAILTTPRAEIRETWVKYYSHTSQPIEDWVTQAQFKQLITNSHLKIVDYQRFALFYGALRESPIDRLLLAILKRIGYQYVEPAHLTTYQLIHAQKPPVKSG